MSFSAALRSIRQLRDALRLVRTWFWKTRYRLPAVDPLFLLSGRCRIHRDFTAGPFGFMNSGCRICPRVSVGRYVMFGPDVSIVGGDHRFEEAGTPMIFSGRPEQPSTIIEDDVWLGARSTIMAGVTIGRGSIVAACAVVTSDVPAYSIVAGVPARVVRSRFDPEQIEVHDEMLALDAYRGEFCEPKA